MGQTKIWYVYADYTMEKVPRIFYVGKGLEDRTKDVIKRNKLWHRISKKYGQKRVIVLGTKDEQYAFAIEKKMINDHKTFAAIWKKGDGWGANLTEGGEGTSGWIPSEETKRKIGNAQLGEKNHMYGRLGEDHPSFGKPKSEEAKQKMSDAKKGKYCGENSPMFGKSLPEETKRKISEAHIGKKLAPEHLAKIVEANTGRVHSDQSKKKFGDAKRGIKNPGALFTELQIKEIKTLSSMNIGDTVIARYYNANRATIRDIRNGKNWKHISISNDEHIDVEYILPNLIYKKGSQH